LAKILLTALDSQPVSKKAFIIERKGQPLGFSQVVPGALWLMEIGMA